MIGAEVIIEEAFMDVFCDLMYGGGWMEIEWEEVNRESNWALVSAINIVLKIRDHGLTCFTLAMVEFKSVPLTRLDLLFLAGQTRTLPPRSSFSRSLSCSNTASNCPQEFKTKEHWPPSQPGKSNQWKQATTLNGRPYIVRHLLTMALGGEELNKGDEICSAIVSLRLTASNSGCARRLDQKSTRYVQFPLCALGFALTDTSTDLSGQREGRKKGMFVLSVDSLYC